MNNQFLAILLHEISCKCLLSHVTGKLACTSVKVDVHREFPQISVLPSPALDDKGF